MIDVFQTFRVLYTLGLHYITLYYITGEIEISNFQHKNHPGIHRFKEAQYDSFFFFFK